MSKLTELYEKHGLLKMNDRDFAIDAIEELVKELEAENEHLNILNMKEWQQQNKLQEEIERLEAKITAMRNCKNCLHGWSTEECILPDGECIGCSEWVWMDEEVRNETTNIL